MTPILVDTSSWISHFQGKSDELEKVLETQMVVTHDFVLGELSLGHFKRHQKDKVFALLTALRRIPCSPHAEVHEFANENKLAGRGIGWIDAHLLHACLIQGVKLMTEDRRLSGLAKQFL